MAASYLCSGIGAMSLLAWGNAPVNSVGFGMSAEGAPHPQRLPCESHNENMNGASSEKKFQIF